MSEHRYCVLTDSLARRSGLRHHGRPDHADRRARGRRGGRLWRVLHVDALLGIIITGVVFGTVLAGQVQIHGIGIWLNAGFHYFAPAWALVGWLVFGPRPRLDWATLGWMFAWPLLWIVYTFAHGAATGWYPYPFLDAHTHGYGIALRNTAAVVVLALIIAGILRALDRRLPTVTTRACPDSLGAKGAQ